MFFGKFIWTIFAGHFWKKFNRILNLKLKSEEYYKPSVCVPLKYLRSQMFWIYVLNFAPRPSPEARGGGNVFGASRIFCPLLDLFL